MVYQNLDVGYELNAIWLMVCWKHWMVEFLQICFYMHDWGFSIDFADEWPLATMMT